MSSFMPIPPRKQASPSALLGSSASSSHTSSPSSSYGTSPRTPSAAPTAWKGKSKVPIPAPPQTAGSSATRTTTSTSSSPPPESWLSPRRPSLLGSSLSKSEYTVINLSHDEGLRLVSCVKSSQGWDWNQELFLPSYAANEYLDEDLEHRPDPVQDIILTDEEIEKMMPR